MQKIGRIQEGAAFFVPRSCTRIVALPHIPRMQREKRGTATHPTHAARETWHCHTSGARSARNVALPRIPRVLRQIRGTATHPTSPAAKEWHCHTSHVPCARTVALPHIPRVLHGKRGAATHPTLSAREPWHCHTSHACCTGNVALPRIRRRGALVRECTHIYVRALIYTLENKRIEELGGDDRIRTGGEGFAGPCLTTWPRRHSASCEWTSAVKKSRPNGPAL